MAYLIAVTTWWRVLCPTPKPKSQGRPIDMDAPVACHFVNACQINGVFRTCFHCNLKASSLDITMADFRCFRLGNIAILISELVRLSTSSNI